MSSPPYTADVPVNKKIHLIQSSLDKSPSLSSLPSEFDML